MATTEQQLSQIIRTLGFIQGQLSSIEGPNSGIDPEQIAAAIAATIQPTEAVEGELLEAEPFDVEGLIERIQEIVNQAIATAIAQADETQGNEFTTLRNLLSEATQRLDQRADGTDKAVNDLSIYGKTAHEQLLEAIANIKLPEFPQFPELDLSGIKQAQEAIAANMALLSKAEQTTLGRIEKVLQRFEHGVLSNDPNDGFLSVVERLSGITGQMDGLQLELSEAVTLAEATPAQSELGEFQEIEPDVSLWGDAKEQDGKLIAGNAWASGGHSERLLQHPGEYLEFTPTGQGMFGLMHRSAWQDPYKGHAAMFYGPGREPGDYSAVCLASGLRTGLKSQPGQPVRITLKEFGIQWANIEGDLVVPRFEFPLSIPTAMAAWFIFGGGGSQISHVKLGLFSRD